MKIYVNGEPQADRRSCRRPEADDPHRGSAQARAAAHRLANRSVGGSHPAHLRPRPLAGRGRDTRRGRPSRRALRTPADKRPREEQDGVFAWWRSVHRPGFPEAAAKAGGSSRRKKPPSRQRGTYRARDARTQPSRRWPTCSTAANTTSAATRSSRTRPTRFRPCRPTCPGTASAWRKWLVRPEHPLTARVTVNRFWQEVFGTGLVRTTGDFGVSGELPSHPELLDWLAVEFRESGWDVKRLFRLMVESATYRQSAATTPEKREKDPHNRLLSRGPRFRMDGEMIRDAALACSGLLGRQARRPERQALPARGSLGSGRHAREQYPFLPARSRRTPLSPQPLHLLETKRPPASLDVFNAPTREICTVRRERTNTPLQALVTLNDPQFVEAARALAQRPQAGGDSRRDCASTSSPGGCWRGRSAPRRRRSSRRRSAG